MKLYRYDSLPLKEGGRVRERVKWVVLWVVGMSDIGIDFTLP
jgi:hypothetical protein